MTALDDWVQRQLATAPPLSAAQLDVIRQVFRPVLPRETEAAPARQPGPPVPAIASPERTDQ